MYEKIELKEKHKMADLAKLYNYGKKRLDLMNGNIHRKNSCTIMESTKQEH